MLTETIAEAQRQGLETVTGLQAKVVEVNRDLADTFGKMLEVAPIPSFAADVLDPSLIDRGFEATIDLLEANRSFVNNLLDAWTPDKKGSSAKS